MSTFALALRATIGHSALVKERASRAGRRRPSSSDAFEFADGSVLVPVSSPPSWAATYFYVVNSVDEFSLPFEPLRCLRLDTREVRRSCERIVLDECPAFSLIVNALAALDTPSGYVVPWQISMGSKTMASLHPPPWLTFAPHEAEGSVSYAVERVRAEALQAERILRHSQVERAMRSSALLDQIRHLEGRRMIVQWFDGDEAHSSSTLNTGRLI